ncbi:probable serine/threonine-protein kinase PBL25 [Lathyrus oleraceus]|uniref:Protein kinase domain-containing protein n=1 Tax=Pisum sativum TaxID=3888 RepID=A0A9D4WAU2_PEA|nr:probable serine/threonine-protein kinase PBL25 [Pisum sativum]KAI5398162.1 hypothetical protein KIW84_063814 [Pisum sativum]
MNCFPCCGPQKNKQSNSKREHGSTTQQEVPSASKAPDMKKQRGDEGDATNINAQNYTFRELATATKNFRQECLLGEGGYGRVYKGVIPATGQAVAVKQLDRHGTENSKDFLYEVSLLSHVNHENLVKLIGYCADGEQRLLVYEYYPASTLEDRLLGNKTDEPPLNWFDRMKVAAGASKGLEYLHDNANPPVIFRDLKTCNILLGNESNNLNNAKLSDFGLAKLCGADKMNNAPPRVMGTYGYCAPEYTRTGQVSMKSDVYSFGVVLLELITGRRAVDTTKPNDEQNLVSWAQPLFRDPKKYPDMADPLLNKHFPEKDLNQAVAIAAMCLQEEPEARPLIGDVVTALSFLSTAPTEPFPPPSLPAATSVSRHSTATESEYSESESEEETSDDEGTDNEYDSSAQNHGAASAKHKENDVSSQSKKRATSKKSSRKSSTRSRNETTSADAAGGNASSSGKSSKKWKSFVGNLSHKSNSSKKSSIKEISQKSSKKNSTKEPSQKSSRKSSTKGKSSGKVSSRAESEDRSMISSHRTASSQYTGSSMSDRSSSRGSGSIRSDTNGSRRTEESMRLAMESGDEGTGPPFDRTGSSESDRR